MVMSKVSKAIAASFLCLTINVGYDVTNAMKENDSNIEDNCCNVFDYAPVGDPVYKGKKNDFFPNEDNEKKASKQVNDGQDKDEKDKNDQDKKDKNDQDKKDKNDQDKDDDKDGKSKNIWRCLIGLITGVGGLVVGFCFGKFVLQN